MQHQLPEGRRHRRGVCGQPQQPQRHRRAAFGTVFQGSVHQALIGKGQRMLQGTLRRGGGRMGAIPQFQQMDLVPLSHQFGSQAAPQQGVGTGRVFHPVKNQ